MDPVSVFLTTLALLLVTVYVFRHRLPPVIDYISAAGKSALPSTPDELPKFALLRIGLGIILSLRAYEVLIYLIPADYTEFPLAFYAIMNLLTGLLLIAGLLTQYVLVYLVLFQWQIGDVVLGTSTLGNDVAAILAVLLAITNSGRSLSLDGILLRRFPGKYISACLLYYQQIPDARSIIAAKMAALFSYWLVCLYSLSMHLNEPAWTSGIAGPLVLSSNFMSQYHIEFISFFAGGEFPVLLGRLSLWLMMAWYPAVFPLVLLGSLWKKYVVIWGILFFLLSLFVLQLGRLAEIEFILWAALFWNIADNKKHPAFELAFDDKCNLCDKTVQIIRSVDIFNRVTLFPVSLNKSWLEKHGVTEESALADLYGYDASSGRIYSGYDLYTRLAGEVVLLLPFYPLLLLGKLFQIGPAIYRWVASRRRKLFGICRIPRGKKPPPGMDAGLEDRTQHLITGSILLHMLILGLFYILAIPAPYLGYKGWQTSLADAAHVYGIAPINVFNEYDLRMAENWFTLTLVRDDEEIHLPILGKDGSRLAYHASDRIYFGNTLRYRRYYIDREGCFYDNETDRMVYLSRVYLHKNSYPPGKYRLIYRQYHQQLPDYDLLLSNRYSENAALIRCEVTFSVDFR